MRGAERSRTLGKPARFLEKFDEDSARSLRFLANEAMMNGELQMLCGV